MNITKSGANLLANETVLFSFVYKELHVSLSSRFAMVLHRGVDIRTL